jgi:hypothetical protein
MEGWFYSMGMSGNYFAIEDKLVQQIAAGEIALEDLNPDDYSTLDIDKSWQAIHYLLCEDIADGEPPLGYVVPMMDDQGIDFGEFGAFYLRAGQVAEALQAIADMDEALLRSRYDFAAMVRDQVYPIVSGEDAEELFTYMLEHFKAIRHFYSQTATDGKGLIFYIF